MEKLDKIIKEEHIMSEAEALRLDDMLRRSIRKEGEEIGINKGKVLGLAEGKNLGIEERTNDMIKAMINNNASYEFISKVSGKSIKDIMKIKESI